MASPPSRPPPDQHAVGRLKKGKPRWFPLSTPSIHPFQGEEEILPPRAPPRPPPGRNHPSAALRAPVSSRSCASLRRRRTPALGRPGSSQSPRCGPAGLAASLGPKGSAARHPSRSGRYAPDAIHPIPLRERKPSAAHENLASFKSHATLSVSTNRRNSHLTARATLLQWLLAIGPHLTLENFSKNSRL